MTIQKPDGGLYEVGFDTIQRMEVVQDIAEEVERSIAKHGDFNQSAHQGYAVILEEVNELWDEIKAQVPDKVKMRKEAVQIAAMCVKFIEDVCDE